ncbi:amidohydrolase family protein [Kineosporia sp. J2-2]|uniref:Amidohydrolase family protein n=1 Tax=Kineosporia corallincola TaxID=2835133 RepID=A0ABS5TBG1_9ACTN|nr:amidohydrolase family protein [Kineosporia corallincola]MBT0768405.1 amidohydrolase family protein [Kineosporia corallincola]
MPGLLENVTRLAGATLPDGRTVDVDIDDGMVTAVNPADAGRPTAVTDPHRLDLTGFLLLTAPAEPHSHLDKALSWDEIQPPMGDLGLAIDSWRAHSRAMTTPGIAARATAALRMMLANGTTAVRTHVDLLPGPEPLRGVRALTGLREQVRHLLDLQIVALAAPDTPTDVVHAALDLGVDLVGGAPHLAPDPLRDLDRLLAIARERGVGADLHTDENLTATPTLAHYARSVTDWPADRVRSAGHCVRQGTMTAAELAPTVEAVRAAGIGIISLPITNLYLQGWEHPVATPRGLTALRAFLDAGVPVAGGADNLRDPFNPVGRADALETASLLVTAGHLTLDEAYHAIADGSRAVLGLPPAGARVGAVADFLAVRGTSLGEVVAAGPAERRVIHRGVLVSRSSVVHETAL